MQIMTEQVKILGENGRRLQLITEDTRVHLTDRDTQFLDCTLTTAVQNVLVSLEIWAGVV